MRVEKTPNSTSRVRDEGQGHQLGVWCWFQPNHNHHLLLNNLRNLFLSTCGSHISRTVHLILLILKWTRDRRSEAEAAGTRHRKWRCRSQQQARWRQHKQQFNLQLRVQRSSLSFAELWINSWTALCAAAVEQHQGCANRVLQPVFTCPITAGHFYSFRKKSLRPITAGPIPKKQIKSGHCTCVF